MRVQIVGPIRIGLNSIETSRPRPNNIIAYNIVCDYVGLVKCCILNIV